MEWKLCYAANRQCKTQQFLTVNQLEAAGYDCIPARVPGNFELDLMAAGREKDLYYSVNTLRAQQWEIYHVWYFTTFDADAEQYLHFGGIDTVADIILNGTLVRHVENMYLSYDFDVPLKAKGNELIVHIYPAVLEARRYPLPASCASLTYNQESLYIRKAPHMYGWDIMPRIVSCGLWRPVELRRRKANSIQDAFLYTREVNLEQKTAAVVLDACLTLAEDELAGYSYRLELSNKNSQYTFTNRLYHNHINETFDLQNCDFWWPKNAGEPCLYQVKLTLLYQGQACDESCFFTGIRTVQLQRTEACDEQGNGEFVFRVNGKKIFLNGTNWVPLDAFHSRDEERLPQAVQMLEDLNCNVIRCWGGNVYGSPSLYDYCDAHGILVWQDFAMACGVYPMEERFYNLLREEAEFIVKQLRNHPSLALWAGDNECDMTYVFWRRQLRDPARYTITRRILPEVVETHDFTRPYLASSPYLSTEALQKGTETPEDHLWGPRTYFKMDYYTQNHAHFASETGYHGCPSPKSLQKFIAPENLWPITDENGEGNEDYLVHAACMEPQPQKPYAYRIPLMVSQVQLLFGRSATNLEEFAKMSQISQAEAKKFFIERFRMGKWERTGIIWWNLLDGWPQISDAVVDYYGVKKLAYQYIKRSQQPVCLMFSEKDEAGRNTLFGVNDLPKEQTVAYEVWDSTTNTLLSTKNAVLEADSSIPLEKLTLEEYHFILIRWKLQNGTTGTNHYYTRLQNVEYTAYLQDLKACGYDTFEGF